MEAIDLNSDLGEGAGDDAGIMTLVTSANIACGGHAGDPASMREALELAKRHGVAAGAHPGYEDRENFGRRELELPPEAVAALVERQVGVLAAVAESVGVVLRHVKPHGGLYNRAARDPVAAGAVADGVLRAGPRLVLVGLAGSELIAAGRRRGLAVAGEAFADRGYRPDGTLIPRGEPGALLGEAEAVAQALRFAREGRAETLCLHGDSPGALALAGSLRRALAGAGFRVAALGSIR